MNQYATPFLPEQIAEMRHTLCEFDDVSAAPSLPAHATDTSQYSAWEHEQVG